jgi:hypothetical protein
VHAGTIAPTCEPGAAHAGVVFSVRPGLFAIGWRCSKCTMPTRLRHVRHVHAGWPASYTGVIAAVLFGLAVVGYAIAIWFILRA